jgi:hypothetical protein
MQQMAKGTSSSIIMGMQRGVYTVNILAVDRWIYIAIITTITMGVHTLFWAIP